MQKLIIVFFILLTVFVIIWIMKPKSPYNRNDDAIGDSNSSWWQNGDSSAVEVPDEWILDPEIPENYVPVPGENEVYMVLNNVGNIVQYRQREKTNDGSWVWTTISEDEEPVNIEIVENLNDVYKITDKDGEDEYIQYVRNEDNSYAYVPVDVNGNPTKYITASGDNIPDNYSEVDDNIYAVKNENNVIIGYQEKIIDDDEISWQSVTKPIVKPSVTTTTISSLTTPELTTQPALTTSKPTLTTQAITTAPIKTTSKADDDSYSETESSTEIKVENGYRVTYLTKITKTYDSDGILLSTKKEGPTEIYREKILVDTETPDADKNKIETNINNEVVRIGNGLTYEDDIANAVLTKLNAERKESGLNPLTMKTDSDAYKIARIYAADMAIYNHSDYNSPLYGSINDLFARYNISVKCSSSNLWKATTKTAEQINTRFQTLEKAREIRMNKDFKEVGISIVSKDGYYYIIEVFVG